MDIASSKKKKAAPVSDSGSDKDGSHLFGPTDTKTSYRILSVRKRARAGCNSEGQDREFSAGQDSLVEEVDRILARCENTDARLDLRTSCKMFGSKSSGLCYAKRHDSNQVYRGSQHDELQQGVCVKNEVNTLHKPTSNIHGKKTPPKGLLISANTENTAKPLCYGIGRGPSQALPVMYDALEEDLMNMIEREFG